jgi:hypothetical protein
MAEIDRLRQIPIENVGPPCNFCRWVLLDKTETVRRWRCARCFRWLEAPISRRHEIQWRKLPKPGPPHDQRSIYDALGLTTEVKDVD